VNYISTKKLFVSSGLNSQAMDVYELKDGKLKNKTKIVQRTDLEASAETTNTKITTNFSGKFVSDIAVTDDSKAVLTLNDGNQLIAEGDESGNICVWR